MCEICTQHPRFHNEYGNIRQTGLGMACEEATRLMFETKGILDYARFRERIQSQRMTLMNQFLEIQLWILDLLKKKENSVEQRIEQIFDVVQGIQDHLNQTGEILNTWKMIYKEESYIKSNARRNIYQKLDIYISELDLWSQRFRRCFARWNQCMHDQRTRNR